MLRRWLQAAFDKPYFIPSLNGAQRWDVAFELSARCKYLAFWSDDMLKGHTYQPKHTLQQLLPEMQKVKIHYNLLSILPDILSFTIFLSRSIKAVASLSEQRDQGASAKDIGVGITGNMLEWESDTELAAVTLEKFTGTVLKQETYLGFRNTELC
jgi:hypothetical protein